MRIGITGATGLVGSNLVAQLAARGHELVCSKRSSSFIDHLDPYDVEWRVADVTDLESLQRCFEGCEAVFHCAAAVEIRQDIPDWMWEVNVVGTENVVEAVRTCGVGRLVYCSSVVAAAVSDDGRPVTEEDEYNFAEHGLTDGYTRTKYAAEQVVWDAVEDGLDAVVVQPGYMFGPLDPKAHSSGEMIMSVVRRQLPAYTVGYNTFVDVRDVVRGMIAAMEKADPGEKYILAGVNMTYRDAFELIAEVAGVKPPRLKAPRVVSAALGLGGDLYERVTGKTAKINSAAVKYSTCSGYRFSSEKAKRDLGYEISPVEDAIRDAIEWYRENDML